MRTPDQAAVPVLFVLPTLGTGGSERVVFNLCLHGGPQFFPVVAAFRDGALRKEMTAAGICSHVLGRRGGIDLSLILKLVRLMRQYRIRLVNSHHFVSLFYAFWAARWMGLPIMHTEHSKWEMEGRTPFWNGWFRFFLRNIELVNAVSEASFAHLQQAYPGSTARTALTLNGIDMDRFNPSGDRMVLRESLGLKADDVVVGTVGNLRREKNQALLIRAIALLKEWGRGCRGVIVGDGPCRKDLEDLAADLEVGEEIIFLGTRNDAPSLYAAFDIYCLCSRYEGLPLTLLEAMAASVPVIGTRVLGIADVINHDVNGLLVPDDSSSHLAAAIAVLVSDASLRQRITARGYRFVSENYLLEKSVSRYKELFCSLLP
ncbi:glycosyltransferase [Geotalea sp. SG265]|uniref:glycosyltransferase n=1 Tax=Geotalea sp. SG265 TaxID=2922867 RepID=UPI001FAFD378|nr:glycosyltransferase [Geotalea sp. SG265]